MSVEPTKILEWTPEYTVHVPEIDREHQLLFGLVSRLHEAMLAGQGTKILGTFFAELMKFTRSHFASEEKIMASMRYPEMLAHIQQHDQIRRRMAEVEARF